MNFLLCKCETSRCLDLNCRTFLPLHVYKFQHKLLVSLLKNILLCSSIQFQIGWGGVLPSVFLFCKHFHFFLTCSISWKLSLALEELQVNKLSNKNHFSCAFKTLAEICLTRAFLYLLKQYSVPFFFFMLEVFAEMW